MNDSWNQGKFYSSTFVWSEEDYAIWNRLCSRQHESVLVKFFMCDLFPEKLQRMRFCDVTKPDVGIITGRNSKPQPLKKSSGRSVRLSNVAMESELTCRLIWFLRSRESIFTVNAGMLFMVKCCWIETLQC